MRDEVLSSDGRRRITEVGIVSGGEGRTKKKKNPDTPQILASLNTT